MAEKEIKELNKHFGKKLIKSSTTNRLWDDCIDFETYIWSNTIHGIYKLDVEVSETIMSEEMSDIS